MVCMWCECINVCGVCRCVMCVCGVNVCGVCVPGSSKIQ